MKIYTKTGDRGETGLLGPLRVSKSDPRIAAYGEVDELNAALGLTRAVIGVLLVGEGIAATRDRSARAGRRKSDRSAMTRLRNMNSLLGLIQAELFVLGAQLATQPGIRLAVKPITRTHIARLERAIDSASAKLPSLSAFILPGGSELAAELHVARTICRRAERAIVALAKKEEVAPDVIVYVNRLSDLLFVLARLANASAGVPDTPWVAPKSRER